MNDSVIFFVPAYNASLAIASSTASICGSILLVASFIRWKENRTLSRLIITLIAVSDLITACGYLVMSAFFLHSRLLDRAVNLSSVKDRPVFDELCTGQSFVTTTSSMWSFWWTVVLAVHLFLSLVFMRLDLSKKLFPLYATLSFGVPLLLTIPAVATGWLGVGCGTTSVTWCYVAAKNNCVELISKVLEAVLGKIWEILAFVCIAVMYVWMWCSMIRLRRKSNPEKDGLLYASIRTVPRAVDWKILALPLVFLFIRSWGSFRYLLSLDLTTSNWLVEDGVNFGRFLASMQSIFDPSQGWVNAIIFLLLSKYFYTWAYGQLKRLKLFFVGCCVKVTTIDWCWPCRTFPGTPSGHTHNSRGSSIVYTLQNSSSDNSSQVTVN